MWMWNTCGSNSSVYQYSIRVQLSKHWIHVWMVNGIAFMWHLLGPLDSSKCFTVFVTFTRSHIRMRAGSQKTIYTLMVQHRGQFGVQRFTQRHFGYLSRRWVDSNQVVNKWCMKCFWESVGYTHTVLVNLDKSFCCCSSSVLSRLVAHGAFHLTLTLIWRSFTGRTLRSGSRINNNNSGESYVTKLTYKHTLQFTDKNFG